MEQSEPLSDGASAAALPPGVADEHNVINC